MKFFDKIKEKIESKTKNPGNLNKPEDTELIKKKKEEEKTKVEDKKIESIKQPSDEFIKVGIPGFDELVEKGIPKGSSVLLAGGPGSGKTTFTLHTIAYSCQKGEKCLYMSFEESVERLRKHMQDYSWKPEEYEAKGLLRIKRLDPFEISRSVEALLAAARGELLIDINEITGLIPEDFKPDRIILDSLSAVAAAFAGKEEGYRIYVEQLFRALEKTQATSFLITEVPQSLTKYSKSGVEEFLADGVVAFYNIRKANLRVSAIEIVKIRGVAHKKRIVPFSLVKGKGMEIYPTEEVFAE